MVRSLQVEELDNIGDLKPQEFKGRFEMIDGKRVLVIQTKAEVIKKSDGTQDVVMSVPTLDLVNKFKQENS